MTFDPRMITGPALVVMGALFLLMAWRLWRVHPLNRVFRLGPYVTEQGMKEVIRLRLTFASFGLFFLVQGATGIVFWYHSRDVNDPLVAFLGSLAAGLGVWAAYMAAVRLLWIWRD